MGAQASSQRNELRPAAVQLRREFFAAARVARSVQPGLGLGEPVEHPLDAVHEPVASLFPGRQGALQVPLATPGEPGAARGLAQPQAGQAFTESRKVPGEEFRTVEVESAALDGWVRDGDDPDEESGEGPAIRLDTLADQLAAFWNDENGLKTQHRLEGLSPGIPGPAPRFPAKRPIVPQAPIQQALARLRSAR
jgi:hypothetical protein